MKIEIKSKVVLLKPTKKKYYAEEEGFCPYFHAEDILRRAPRHKPKS